MAQISFEGSALGNALQTMFAATEIVPGDEPSYELCKLLYLYHPLGAKMAEAPITMAQSQAREITIDDSPEKEVKRAFLDERKALRIDKHIANAARLSRIYGVSSLALLIDGVAPNEPIDYGALYDQTIAFNVLDPLNTAGSIGLNSDPNSPEFLKNKGVAVSGVPYHPSRTVIKLNEEPIYLGWTTSGYGYVGRSVYQRALYPMKSFIGTMMTDDMISRKAGVLVIKAQQPGSIIDGLMSKLAATKRALLKMAQIGNVMQIGLEESIETLDLKNIDGAGGFARTNILTNIATACDMPAKVLMNETMVGGMAEGTEDAKNIGLWIGRVREDLEPLYNFTDRITQHRAWNPQFYKTIQAKYAEYENVSYLDAFSRWQHSFSATWPSWLIEPESEKVKVDDAKLRGVISLLEVLLPKLDPLNRSIIIQWACDNFNELKVMFQAPLMLDYHALEEYTPPDIAAPEQEPREPRPEVLADAMRKLRAVAGR